MPARITKIPESWKKTYKLVNGELVKKASDDSKNKKVLNKKKEDHPLVVLVVFIGIIFFSCQQSKEVSQQDNSDNFNYSNSPEYIDSVIERSNVGETIDSEQELLDVCILIAQDKGMTYSEAYKTCY